MAEDAENENETKKKITIRRTRRPMRKARMDGEGSVNHDQEHETEPVENETDCKPSPLYLPPSTNKFYPKYYKVLELCIATEYDG